MRTDRLFVARDGLSRTGARRVIEAGRRFYMRNASFPINCTDGNREFFVFACL